MYIACGLWRQDQCRPVAVYGIELPYSCRRQARAFKLGLSFIKQCTATGQLCDWPTLTKWLQSYSAEWELPAGFP